jgi:hypothetical protein
MTPSALIQGFLFRFGMEIGQISIMFSQTVILSGSDPANKNGKPHMELR